MIRMSELRRLAHEAWGPDATVEEHQPLGTSSWVIMASGRRGGVGVLGLKCAQVRRMARAALMAARWRKGRSRQ